MGTRTMRPTASGFEEVNQERSMTTRVTITNAEDSNPAQELVVVSHNASGPTIRRVVDHQEPEDPRGMCVLRPGDSAEFWVSSMSQVVVVERQATPATARELGAAARATGPGSY